MRTSDHMRRAGEFIERGRGHHRRGELPDTRWALRQAREQLEAADRQIEHRQHEERKR